ncbi:hypothetical protein OSB04_026542 [Centaurea solstitialis]|uniref:Uncharacterized protein n=1 Tax=Centaurea solstitialis TaxID=347529 RepID=A0AA38W9E0_9ASTR|nr:hypothetical protein OSB04_026542 [Centaurea solstitialis]
MDPPLYTSKMDTTEYRGYGFREIVPSECKRDNKLDEKGMKQYLLPSGIEDDETNIHKYPTGSLPQASHAPYTVDPKPFTAIPDFIFSTTEFTFSSLPYASTIGTTEIQSALNNAEAKQREQKPHISIFGGRKYSRRDMNESYSSKAIERTSSEIPDKSLLFSQS